MFRTLSIPAQDSDTHARSNFSVIPTRVSDVREESRIPLGVDTRKPPYKSVILKGRVTMEEKVDDERMEPMAIANWAARGELVAFG